MTTTRSTRRRRAVLVLPALLAAAALSAVLALGAPGASGPAIADAHAGDAHAAAPARQVALRQDMRALWEDHITWTRMVIVDFAADLPSLPASQARLLRNQADIGDAIAPFYGRAAGERLTTLLRGHILIAVDVLVAAKAGDAPGLARAQARWTRNADQIAGFLSSANPTAWPRAEMRRMMRHHLRLTTDEAVARLTGDAAADVRAYDRVHAQALEMADMLSAGIIRQFPQRFRRAPA
jgi:hypothetical protein